MRKNKEIFRTNRIKVNECFVDEEGFYYVISKDVYISVTVTPKEFEQIKKIGK